MEKKELEKMIYTYRIKEVNGALSCNVRTQADADSIRLHKEEILRYLAEEKLEKELREKKINEIEGLAELQKAMIENADYRYQFSKNFDDENTSSFEIKKPNTNINELKAKYPRAAAYLKAYSYYNANNVDKSCAGEKAMDRIINGEDYQIVISDMEKEWNNSCQSHLFD